MFSTTLNPQWRSRAMQVKTGCAIVKELRRAEQHQCARSQAPRRASMLATALRTGKCRRRARVKTRSTSLSCGRRLPCTDKARIHRRACLGAFALLSGIKRSAMTNCLSHCPIRPFDSPRRIANITNRNDQSHNSRSDATC